MVINALRGGHTDTHIHTQTHTYTHIHTQTHILTCDFEKPGMHGLRPTHTWCKNTYEIQISGTDSVTANKSS